MAKKAAKTVEEAQGDMFLERPMVAGLGITSFSVKGGEVTANMQGATNVNDIARLTVDSWREGAARWLYSLCQGEHWVAFDLLRTIHDEAERRRMEAEWRKRAEVGGDSVKADADEAAERLEAVRLSQALTAMGYIIGPIMLEEWSAEQVEDVNQWLDGRDGAADSAPEWLAQYSVLAQADAGEIGERAAEESAEENASIPTETGLNPTDGAASGDGQRGNGDQSADQAQAA